MYLAVRDDDEFHKRVAVKVVKRGMDTEEVLGRFRRERQILANLDHPYIARLIDGGSTEDGRPFLAMEFVDGEPIDRYCASRSLPVGERCRLFLKVCEAVSHAHRNLVIHRDLKPGNILITREGSPKLLDFGVAKILIPDLDYSHTLHPKSGGPLTPDYASPEQIRGQAAGTATDVYSLGVILYELLTGVKVQRVESTDPGELEKAICETTPPNPSAVSEKQRRKQLQGDLDNIVLKAMQKEPARRYASVDQFADDIRAYLESRPVIARKDSLWYRTAKFARRRRYPLLAAAAVVLSLIGGIVMAMFQAQQARVARDAAVSAQRSAEGRVAQMVSVSNRSLSDVYARLERLPGAMPARKQLVSSTVDLLEDLSKQAGDDPRVRIALARAYLKLGDLQGDPDAANAGDMPGALKSYRAGAALIDPAAGDPEQIALWADLQNQIGKVLTEVGSPKEAESILNAAIATVEPPRAGDRNRAALYLSMSRALGGFDMPRALEWAKKAVDAATVASAAAPSDNDLQVLLSTTDTQLGYVSLQMGNPEAAEAPYAAAMRIREKLALEHPNDLVFRRYQRLAYEHYAALEGSPERPNLHHPDIARAYYRKAQPLEELDRDDPENHAARFDYAYFLLKMAIVDVGPAEVAESLATLRKCAVTFEALSSEAPGVQRYDRALALAREYIGHRLLMMKQYDAAATEFQRTARLAKKILQQSPGDAYVERQLKSAEDGMARAGAR